MNRARQHDIQTDSILHVGLRIVKKGVDPDQTRWLVCVYTVCMHTPSSPFRMTLVITVEYVTSSGKIRLMEGYKEQDLIRHRA